MVKKQVFGLIWSNLTSKIYLIMKNLARLKTFDLVYPNFKGTCIEFRNGIMQVCWHFKKGLYSIWQGHFLGNSVKCRKQYKAPTNSIRKLTICIDNAGPLRGPALYQYCHYGLWYIPSCSWSTCVLVYFSWLLDHIFQRIYIYLTIQYEFLCNM